MQASRSPILFLFSIVAATLSGHSLENAPQDVVYDSTFINNYLISEEWTTNNGLPVNIINQVYQSPDGYIWLATFNGLIRFDGIEFTEFNAGNSPNLVSNRILTIQKGTANSFWLNTEQRHLILSDNGRFTSFPDLPPTDHFIVFPEKDITWIGSSNGLYQFSDGVLQPFMSDLFDHVDIRSILRSRDGSLWIFGYNTKAWRLKPDDTGYHINTIEIPRNTNTVFQDHDGKIWLGGNQLGYIENNIFHGIPVEKSYLKNWNGENPIFHRFLAVSQESLLVSAETGLLNIENETLTPIDLHEELHFKSLAVINGGALTICPDNSVWSIVENRMYKDGIFTHQTKHISETIFCDQEQNLWLSTFQNGLIRHRTSDIENITFNHSPNNFYGAFSDSYSGYWIGGWFTDLTHIDSAGNIEKIDSNLEFGITAAFAEDANGTLFVGFNKCLPQNRTISGECKKFEKIKGLEALSVFAILVATNKTVWFGTDDGVFYLKNNELIQISPIGENSLQPVRYLLETGNQQIWMATNGGGVYQYKKGDLTVFNMNSGLSSNNIRALYEDEFGFIWIATEDRGLNRLDPNTGEIVLIKTSDGLFDDGLHAILRDDFGNLWMSTNRGIFSVDFKQLHEFASGQRERIYSKAYNERDGMLIREANGGFQNSSLKTDDGKLWFTTQKGIVVIDPSQTVSNFDIPAVIIEDVLSSGKSIMNQVDNIHLSTEQRSINILYNCPVFIAPERIRFRYKLEGFDSDWVDAGNRREAIYTNIPNGEYSFKVAAYFEGEQEDLSYTSLAFIVSPRFFETLWFPVFISMFIVFILGSSYRIRLRYLKKREAELETLVKNQTGALRTEKKLTELQAEKLKILGQEKNRFFANISHEFRTPLTLIIGPLSDLKEGKYGTLPPAVSKQLDLGLRNSQRLLHLVGQLMDLTRLEDKKFEVNKQIGNLSNYLRTTAESFQSAADQKNIHFNIQIPQEPIFVHFDAAHFDKIITNLLSNAFKFTPDYGSIDLQLEKKNNLAVISIMDTGHGIDPEYLPRLFDRFYQVQKSEMQPGSGIGLSLAKELTDLHGGILEVESELNKGSIFSVRLPLLHHTYDTFPDTESDTVCVHNIRQYPTISDRAFHEVENNSGTSNEDQPELKTILIVDDHADIRLFLKNHLAEKYNIIEAASGNEATSIIETHLPDLIISDVMMPDGDGFSLLKNLRKNPETGFLPIILLTARAAAEDKFKGLNIGADDYLTKPFSIKEVTVRVQNLIEKQMRLLNFYTRAGGHINEEKPVLHPDPVKVTSADQQYLEQVRQVVQKHLHNEDFSVEDLAEKMFQSRTQLFRRLRDLIEESPSSLIRRMRLERGAELLLQKAGTVSEVAYSTGFRSVTQFSKSFRILFNKTPTEYVASATK